MRQIHLVPCQVKTRRIIDFHGGHKRISRNGIRIEKDDYGILHDYILVRKQKSIVKNFRDLIVRDANLDDCIFENCYEITIEGGKINNCIFRNIKSIIFEEVEITNTKFEDMTDEGFALMVQMRDSSIRDSCFKNITITNGGYLCEGYGDCLIRDCIFENIEVEDSMEEIFYSCKLHPYLYKGEEYDMVDRESCKGLKQ